MLQHLKIKSWAQNLRRTATIQNGVRGGGRCCEWGVAGGFVYKYETCFGSLCSPLLPLLLLLLGFLFGCCFFLYFFSFERQAKTICEMKTPASVLHAFRARLFTKCNCPAKYKQLRRETYKIFLQGTIVLLKYL